MTLWFIGSCSWFVTCNFVSGLLCNAKTLKPKNFSQKNVDFSSRDFTVACWFVLVGQVLKSLMKFVQPFCRVCIVLIHYQVGPKHRTQVMVAY